MLIQDTGAGRWGWDAATLISPDLALATHPAIRAASAPRTSRSGAEADFPGKVRPCLGSCFVALQSEDAGEALLCWLPSWLQRRCCRDRQPGRGAQGLRSSRGESKPLCSAPHGCCSKVCPRPGHSGKAFGKSN